MKPIFNNVPNKSYKTTCGKTIWDSRSVATCATILRPKPEDNSILQVLAVRRGEKVSHTDRWSLCCGFLDRAETAIEGVRREIYEESGILLNFDELEFDYFNDRPDKDELQNITFHYMAYLARDVDFDLTNVDKGEVTEARWFDINEKEIDSVEWAFGHGTKLKNMIY